MSALGRLRKGIFGINLEEASFARRGFSGDGGPTQQRLERVGRTVIQGYHAALEEGNPARLVSHLESIDLEARGFAYEGAAMGLALLDTLTPWGKKRMPAFLSGPGSPHLYMSYIGIGLTLARLRRRVDSTLRGLDPMFRWLVVDGYGFHEGYFHWPRYQGGQAIPSKISGYAGRAFDQGLGRSMWFIFGGSPARISDAIAAFPEPRRGDIWSGAGLACAYAGGVEQSVIDDLCRVAEPYTPQLAQGAAFAAKTREEAGNQAPQTDLACWRLCRMSADVTADYVTGLAGPDLIDGQEPAYETLRQQIQTHFTMEAETA